MTLRRSQATLPPSRDGVSWIDGDTVRTLSDGRLARVRWLKAADNKAWLHGCEFVNAMTDADLEIIFADLMDKTKMR